MILKLIAKLFSSKKAVTLPQPSQAVQHTETTVEPLQELPEVVAQPVKKKTPARGRKPKNKS